MLSTHYHEHLHIECMGEVLTVTLDRASRLNALDDDMSFALGRIFDDFETDPGLRVALLTGGGTRAFCVGNDLRQQSTGPEPNWPSSGFGGLTARFDRSKPIIAAVNGIAAGGGFELALACDLVIASRAARFSLPEPKVGLAAVAGGLQMLTRQIPLKWAMGMILTGEAVTAEEGLRMGFVNQVVDPDDLLMVAREWAERIRRCAPLSIKASLAGISAGQGLSLAAAQRAQDACDAVQLMKRSSDRKEGAQAFAEKRVPIWEGR